MWYCWDKTECFRQVDIKISWLLDEMTAIMIKVGTVWRLYGEPIKTYNKDEITSRLVGLEAMMEAHPNDVAEAWVINKEERATFLVFYKKKET